MPERLEIDNNNLMESAIQAEEARADAETLAHRQAQEARLQQAYQYPEATEQEAADIYEVAKVRKAIDANLEVKERRNPSAPEAGEGRADVAEHTTGLHVKTKSPASFLAESIATNPFLYRTSAEKANGQYKQMNNKELAAAIESAQEGGLDLLVSDLEQLRDKRVAQAEEKAARKAAAEEERTNRRIESQLAKEAAAQQIDRSKVSDDALAVLDRLKGKTPTPKPTAPEAPKAPEPAANAKETSAETQAEDPQAAAQKAWQEKFSKAEQARLDELAELSRQADERRGRKDAQQPAATEAGQPKFTKAEQARLDELEGELTRVENERRVQAQAAPEPQRPVRPRPTPYSIDDPRNPYYLAPAESYPPSGYSKVVNPEGNPYDDPIENEDDLVGPMADLLGDSYGDITGTGDIIGDPADEDTETEPNDLLGDLGGRAPEDGDDFDDFEDDEEYDRDERLHRRIGSAILRRYYSLAYKVNEKTYGEVKGKGSDESDEPKEPKPPITGNEDLRITRRDRAARKLGNAAKTVFGINAINEKATVASIKAEARQSRKTQRKEDKDFNNEVKKQRAKNAASHRRQSGRHARPIDHEQEEANS